MLRARGKNNFSCQIFGEEECNRADFPSVKRIRKIYDLDMFKAVADSFSISYNAE